jgi:hypothetical protein
VWRASDRSSSGATFHGRHVADGERWLLGLTHVEAGVEMRQDFVVQLTAAKVAMEVLAGVAVCFHGGRLRDVASGEIGSGFASDG